IRIDQRWGAANPETLRTYLASAPDAVLAHTAPVVAAVKRETRTVPIVFVMVPAPVEIGLVMLHGKNTGLGDQERAAIKRPSCRFAQSCATFKSPWATASFNSKSAPKVASRFLVGHGLSFCSLQVDQRLSGERNRCQDFALNLSAKRRLCNTVGG